MQANHASTPAKMGQHLGLVDRGGIRTTHQVCGQKWRAMHQIARLNTNTSVFRAARPMTATPVNHAPAAHSTVRQGLHCWWCSQAHATRAWALAAHVEVQTAFQCQLPQRHSLCLIHYHKWPSRMQALLPADVGTRLTQKRGCGASLMTGGASGSNGNTRWSMLPAAECWRTSARPMFSRCIRWPACLETSGGGAGMTG